MSLAARYLAVLSTPQLGVTRLRRLVTICGGLEAVLAGQCRDVDLPRHRVMTRVLNELAGAAARALPGAERAVNGARELGLGVITWEDPGYPPALTHDEAGCAPVLFVAGALPRQVLAPPHELAACAVVGTRRASPFGLAFARDLARAAAGRGLTVVSGLALGIDAAAHEGALEGAHAAGLAEGATVAVLGGGHARLHPGANRGLAERVVAKGGAVVSEWPPDANPQPHHFLRRNRVIAGLARAVAVVEAGQPSGALNTATHALELGREVLAVPSRPDDARNIGALRLLREGAHPLIEPSDLLAHFPELPAEVMTLAGGGGAARTPPGPAPRAEGLGGRLRELFEPGRHGPGAFAVGEEVSLDRLAGATGAGVQELLATLGLLELDGRVERTGSGRFRWRA